ncbi:hypothetical protein SUGI_0248510 [Cryptomeria japonica]|uniref:uncharacterized protein LOC131874501 n=1 Tax=Cryptomeria japonica TaxID=3369 RepID=UPI002408A753|nr:uncharacterized protein LOC131874501 [Cryptomeria japonica]GLJ15201.1 hypothetical protein SUGI_0248510 [Cryptomeria japonica]
MALPHLICRTGDVLTGQSYDLRNVWHSNQRSMSGRRRGRLKVVAERPCKSNSNSEFPNMADIMKVGSAQNVQVQVKSWGPVFEVRAISMVTGEEIGRANGFITLWFGRKGKILHLESTRMTRQAFTMHNTSIFGMGLLVGAIAIRHGFDCNCKTAELLAINDSPLYHSKVFFLVSI